MSHRLETQVGPERKELEARSILTEIACEFDDLEYSPNALPVLPALSALETFSHIYTALDTRAWKPLRNDFLKRCKRCRQAAHRIQLGTIQEIMLEEKRENTDHRTKSFVSNFRWLHRWVCFTLHWLKGTVTADDGTHSKVITRSAYRTTMRRFLNVFERMSYRMMIAQTPSRLHIRQRLGSDTMTPQEYRHEVMRLYNVLLPITMDLGHFLREHQFESKSVLLNEETDISGHEEESDYESESDLEEHSPVVRREYTRPSVVPPVERPSQQERRTKVTTTTTTTTTRPRGEGRAEGEEMEQGGRPGQKQPAMHVRQEPGAGIR